MATPPHDQSSFITTCNRILATAEQLAEQWEKGSGRLDRLLSLKLSHPDIFSDEVEMILKVAKRLNDAKMRKLRDGINKAKLMFSEPSPDHFQEFGSHFDSLQIEEQVNRGGQEIHEWNYKVRAFGRVIAVKNPQIEELNKILSDDEDVATQADAKVETTPTSSGN